MTKIYIPPAALEAGARAIAESLRTARLTLESEDGYKPEARAAFEAMVAAWPGAHHRIGIKRHESGEWRQPYPMLCLPLPQEGGDE